MGDEKRKMPPKGVADTISKTAGGAHIPDPSDIPGGAYGRRENMNESAQEAAKEAQIDAMLGEEKE